MLDSQRAAMMELAAANYDPEQISALLRYNAGHFDALVASGRATVMTERSRIVGCAAWQPSDDSRTASSAPRIAEVRSVYVHPDFARRGVASVLLMHVERQAKAAGVSELRLLATFNAVQFYRNHGFAARGAGTLEIGSTSLPGIAMSKSLIEQRSAA